MNSLRTALLVGAYSRALQRLDVLEKSGRIQLLTQAAQSAKGGKCEDLEPVASNACAVAELYFYMGRDEEARALLVRYAQLWLKSREQFDRAVGGALPRERLQIAEYFYSLGKYDVAERLARATLAQAQDADDRNGAAESSYSLMRILRRVHNYSDVDANQHAAIESFTAASKRNGHSKEVLPWRLGLVYLVAGFTQWRAGNLSRATALLNTAACLLETSDDFIAKANVRHTFGVILRSQGRREEALAELQHADRLYEKAGHQLNRARVTTDIGRVHLDLGDWKAAHLALRTARELSESCKSPRQQSEVALWTSWLAQSKGTPYFNLDEASVQAETASQASAFMVRVEGHIAYGYALAERSMLGYAKEEFDAALSAARKTEMSKHLANALLSLADFHSRYAPRNFVAADSYYRDAADIITEQSSAFLRRKLDAVGKQIALAVEETKDQSLFVRSIEEVMSHGVKDTKRKLVRWAMHSALKKANGDRTRAAISLKVTPEYFRKQLAQFAGRKNRHARSK